MQINFTLNTTDRNELEEAIAFLELCLSGLALPDPDDLMSIVRTLLADTYGPGRLGYVRLVADAGDQGASAAEVAAHFGGNGRSIGGTHASLEQSWRGLGGEQFFDEFIHTDNDGSHHMHSLLRAAVAQIFAEREANITNNNPPTA